MNSRLGINRRRDVMVVTGMCILEFIR